MSLIKASRQRNSKETARRAGKTPKMSLIKASRERNFKEIDTHAAAVSHQCQDQGLQLVIPWGLGFNIGARVIRIGFL